MGRQYANGNMFHGFGNFVMWLLKSFGNVFKGVGIDPDANMELGGSVPPTTLKIIALH